MTEFCPEFPPRLRFRETSAVNRSEPSAEAGGAAVLVSRDAALLKRPGDFSGPVDTMEVAGYWRWYKSPFGGTPPPLITET